MHATTEMNLKSTMLCEKALYKKKRLPSQWFYLCMTFCNAGEKQKEHKPDWWLPGAGDGSRWGVEKEQADLVVGGGGATLFHQSRWLPDSGVRCASYNCEPKQGRFYCMLTPPQ